MKGSLENEVKKTARVDTACLSKDERKITNIIDPTRYSSFTKLVRITAWCIKFVKNCKGKQNDEDELTAENIERSKEIWVMDLQREMKEDKGYGKMVESLGIKEDKKGYLRCMGRLGRGKLPFNIKHPLLLPAVNWVTNLIIMHCHENVYHNGVKETLAEFRSNHWIARGRQRVKAVVGRC